MNNIENALAWADHKKAAIVPAHTLAAEVRRLRAELAALTAENKGMRDALIKIMTWWPTVSFARMTLLINPVQVCREALFPEPEKPAPDGEGRKEEHHGA